MPDAYAISGPGPDQIDYVEIRLDQTGEYKAEASVPTAIKNPATLPLSHIPPETFERLIAEIVGLDGNSSVHFYGRRGQKQHGLDIFEEQSDGTRILYQVKRYAEASISELKAAVEAYCGIPRAAASEQPQRIFNPQRFIVVTSAEIENDTKNTGAIAELQDRYRGDISIDIWGAEAVSRRLRRQANIVSAIFGQAWAREFCGNTNIRRAKRAAADRARIEAALSAMMAVQYTRDNEVRFRQVELNGVTVDSLFVDVPASTFRESAINDFLRRIQPHQEPTAQNDRTQDSTQAGAAQALLHPEWRDSAVIVGGPGQGKTTLLQYLCQFYRARALGRKEYSPIAADLAPVTQTSRIPIKIELTEYAEWRRTKIAASEPKASATIEAYTAALIADASTHTFSVKDVVSTVTTRPILLALDSLDEIADAQEREHIADEIREANARMRVSAKDFQLLVATRPGAVGRPIWRDPGFVTLLLNQLTPALRQKYVDRWAEQSKLDPSEVKVLKRTFAQSIVLPHVIELAGNPMQLAILLHLMQRRAVLPQKRTALYDRYIDIFLDRESKSAVVAEYKDLIVSFHKLLAWHIHTRVELGQSRGSVDLDDLKTLLSDYLRPRGLETAILDELFQSVTTRVLCLVQRDVDSGQFQFEVQPLREYFAAEHIFDAVSGNMRPSCLETLVRRPYWSNVMRFFAGKLTSGEVPVIVYALRELQEDQKIGKHPISRSVAKTLLDDQVFAGQLQRVTEDLIRVILVGPGAVLAADGLLAHDGANFRFHDQISTRQSAGILFEALRNQFSPTQIESIVALVMALGLKRDCVAYWWDQLGLVDGTHWLRVGAALDLFESLNDDQINSIQSNLPALNPESGIFEDLARSRATRAIDPIANRLLDEIKLGNIDADSLDGPSIYSRLGQMCGPKRAYLRFAGPAVRNGGGETGGRLRVRGSVSTPWAAVVTAMPQVDGSEKKGAGSWKEFMEGTSSAWGADCWPIREAVWALPEEYLSLVPTSASAKCGSSWQEVAKWRSEAIANRSNDEWWLAQIPKKIDDKLLAMTFLLSVSTIAQSTVLEKLHSVVNQCSSSLSKRGWAVCVAALRRYQHAGGRNPANIADSLRLRQIFLTGRSAVLLWLVATGSSKSQLCHFITPDLLELWDAGRSVDIILNEFLVTNGREIPAKAFAGARSSVGDGALASTRIGRITYRDAELILSDPASWPHDVVRLAVDHLATRLAKQEPVASVAALCKWFP